MLWLFLCSFLLKTKKINREASVYVVILNQENVIFLSLFSNSLFFFSIMIYIRKSFYVFFCRWCVYMIYLTCHVYIRLSLERMFFALILFFYFQIRVWRLLLNVKKMLWKYDYTSMILYFAGSEHSYIARTTIIIINELNQEFCIHFNFTQNTNMKNIISIISIEKQFLISSPFSSHMEYIKMIISSI